MGDNDPPFRVESLVDVTSIDGDRWFGSTLARRIPWGALPWVGEISRWSVPYTADFGRARREGYRYRR
jgi:hypothetical protein